SSPGGVLVQNQSTVAVALSRKNTVAVVDLNRWAVVREVPVGVAPYGMVSYGHLVCVSHWGGRHPKPGDKTGRTAGSPMIIDPVTSTAASGSVSVIDTFSGKTLGTVDVGLHPCALAMDESQKLLYVANANSDTISVIDFDKRKVVKTIPVRPLKDLPFGCIPNALSLTADGKRLYVANGTNNAVAVVDTAEGRVVGFLPVGWFPSGLALDESRGWLHVANLKGVGSLHPITGRHVGHSDDSLGSVSIITDLSKAALEAGGKTVAETNRHTRLQEHLAGPDPNAKPVPVPHRHGEPSVFEHVIYVIKENRTYDQILGDLPQGNGDPSLCIFGRDITPNHHALVEEFVLLDNFYCSGVRSADGHNWTDEGIVTDYVEKVLGLFVRSHGDDPLSFAPSGFIWDNALANGKTFRCYGEHVEPHLDPMGTFKEVYDDFIKGTGKYKIWGDSDIPAIAANLCPTYPGFAPLISDVYRAAEFIKELKAFETKGTYPNLAVVFLPNDHTVGTIPGFPTPAAALADNDLALGRLVEAVSHSKFWPKTCILVVEDDPFSGWDHVDGHRTVAMAISPYTKRNVVVSTRYTQPGMVKTIELMLGIPAMHQMDLFAHPMRECFTTKPDYTPYKCRDNNVALDKLTASLDRLEGQARADALASMQLDMDEEDKADETTLNRIVWRTMKGDAPYPGRKR
ncbi:MAG: beta-propeller fold lactonase family protein, partial [Planctomycetes bacterium]|nr:beta-propeller fold lactonase family protein [Planctomycetota bacterium]